MLTEMNNPKWCVFLIYNFRANFGAKLEHLLSSRAEIISRMHKPPAAEGNDLEQLLGNEPIEPIPVPQPNCYSWPDEKAAAYCALTPPLETFMVVPEEIRRDQFFHTARQDDVLIGSISAIQDSGLIITLLAYDQGPRRDFEGLKLTGFCPVRQLPRYAAHGSALDAFQMNEKVRIFILDVHHSGRLILSMNPKAMKTENGEDLKLGIVTDDDLPLHYKKLQNLDGKSFEACLESTPQFRNPDGLRVLCSRFGIPRASACSLLLSMAKINLPKPEMACELRRVQLYNLSMKHVAQGVKYFKDGRNTEAIQCYNFALEVEGSNPDAFVARGALYASIGTYAKALEDLEKSLQLQPNHANAQNYLGQTLLAYACELTGKEPAKAEQLLKRALVLDPGNEEAREALRELPTTGNQIMDASMNSWSRSPSPKKPQILNRHPVPAPVHLYGRSPMSPSGHNNSGNRIATHVERSRVALEQLVEDDRSRKAAKEASRRNETEKSPGFYSGHRRYGDEKHRDDTRFPSAFEKNNNREGAMEKGDFAKIVITRNISGRTIRCEEDSGWPDHNRDHRRRDDWKQLGDSEMAQATTKMDGSSDRQIPQDQCLYDRRVFTPPKDAKEVENGVLTHYTNESDLPMTSKTLQARIQQRLKDIENRHGSNMVGPPGSECVDSNQGMPLSTGGPPQPGNGFWHGRGVHTEMDRRGGYLNADRRGGVSGNMDRRGGGSSDMDRRGGGSGDFDRRYGGAGDIERRTGASGDLDRRGSSINIDRQNARGVTNMDRHSGESGDIDRRGGPGDINRREMGPNESNRRETDDRRGSGSNFRSDFYRGNFHGRGRSRGGPRWRGQWNDDWRGSRRGGGWNNRDNRYGDRREPIPIEDGRRRRLRRSGTGGGAVDRSRSPSSRSRRDSKSRSASRNRSVSRSVSRSARSYSRSVSRSPTPKRKKPISRARRRTPPLAPLTNRHSESEEQMADVEQFIAQLKVKRQMQQNMHGPFLNTTDGNIEPPTIGPQMPPVSDIGATNTVAAEPPSPE